jgi:hypothetical protein
LPSRAAQRPPALRRNRGTDAIDVRVAEASLGSAHASLAGKLLAPRARRQARGKIKLVEFDPAPWWRGSADSPLARHPADSTRKASST